jgi:tetratricopeptide (TPR) repeat protein
VVDIFILHDRRHDRVRFAPGSAVKVPLFYFGGSFSTAMQNQPRFWVFMMGKIIWPTGLSADYTPENVGIQLAPALLILLAVLGLQGWLAWKSKVGALGVAVYWLGLATVSNFIPLNRFLADRFYYLPLAGVALQLFAVFLFVLQIRPAFWALFALLIAALLPFTWLTVVRQSIFTDNFTLWTDTIRVSPFSSGAHNGLGSALAHRGEVDAAIAEYDKALQIWPDWFQAEINLGNAYVQKGDVPDAVHYYEKSLKDYPNIPDAENNLGVLLLRQGKVDEAMTRFEKASELNPYYEYAHVNLGTAFARKGRLADAIAEFEKAVLINPDDSQAQTDLAQARAQAAMASRSR